MKIIDKRNKPVEFSDLVIGAFFEYKDDFWIKYAMGDIQDNNCLNLDDGVRKCILPETMVVPVEVELIINR